MRSPSNSRYNTQRNEAVPHARTLLLLACSGCHATTYWNELDYSSSDNCNIAGVWGMGYIGACMYMESNENTYETIKIY